MMARKKLYPVDGRMMTIEEAGALAGVSAAALFNMRWRNGGMSIQGVVDLYRRGFAGAGKPLPVRHCVHGEWMTKEEAAERCGVARVTLDDWRRRHRQPDGRPGLVEAAYDHYMAVNRGEAPRYPGSLAPRKTYWVDGKRLSMRLAAERAGVPEYTLRAWVRRHDCSVQAAVRHYRRAAEAAAIEQAAAEIMRVLAGAGVLGSVECGE